MPKTLSKPATITILQAAKNLREMFPPRVVNTWLMEFGYTSEAAESPFVGAADSLEWAVMERGARIRRELVIHAKRLADRQTMGAGHVVCRTEVIR